MKYWITGSIPSTWVVQAQGEQDPDLGGGFLIMRMLGRTAKQFSATCHWYETGYGSGYRRTSFQVTVGPDDMMWPIYQKTFANPKDKGRWLQALGAACMFKTPTASTQYVTASTTGYIPQDSGVAPCIVE